MSSLSNGGVVHFRAPQALIDDAAAAATANGMKFTDFMRAALRDAVATAKRLPPLMGPPTGNRRLSLAALQSLSAEELAAIDASAEGQAVIATMVAGAADIARSVQTFIDGLAPALAKAAGAVSSASTIPPTERMGMPDHLLVPPGTQIR